MRYLLDTKAVSDLVRHPQGKVAQHIRKVGEAQICTSIIVAAELRYGAAKQRSPRLSAQLEGVLEALEVLPLETQPTDCCVRGWNRLAGQSAPMTCWLRRRQLRLVIRSSPITKRNLRGSRVFHTRIGCAEADRGLIVSVDFEAVDSSPKGPQVSAQKCGADTLVRVSGAFTPQAGADILTDL